VTASFNPLAGLDPDSEEFTAECGLLADALIITSGKDRYFSDGARKIVRALIEHLRLTRPDASLADVNRVLQLPHEQFIAYMLGAEID